MKKLAIVVLTMSAAVFGVGMVAEAQTAPYGGDTNTLTLTPPTVTPGSSVSVDVNGCTSGESVDLSVDNAAAATTTCVGSGTATGVIEAPTAAGTYTVAAVGNQGFTSSSALVVTAAATPAAGGLPATGSDGISTTVALGAGLFAVGIALVVVAQLRRRRDVSAA
jgi:LPXTG-motif cell wall-anchored protein